MAAGVTDRQWLLTTGNVFRSERFFSKRSRSLGGRVRAEVARRSAGESSIQGWGESSGSALPAEGGRSTSADSGGQTLASSRPRL